MEYRQIYKHWLKKEGLDSEIFQELKSIEHLDEEIKERFYQDLAFGTAGLRGILGAGTNRMNLYTIRRATQGFAQAINNSFSGEKKMVIAYDSRRKSRQFAEEAACVFAANGIRTYVFTEVTPTPILSYATRLLGCSGGVMITASHNPKNYNGYKVYWDDGAQVTEEKAALISEQVASVKEYLDIRTESLAHYIEQGMVEMIYEKVYVPYYREIENLDYMEPGSKSLSILFSPFFGTTDRPVAEVMNLHQFSNYQVLEEQRHPNPEFPQLDYPNPEDPASFQKLREAASAMERQPDLLMATDPDGDRIGCQVLHHGSYVVLTGNQMGILMVEYLLNEKPIPSGGYIVKTVVTADLSARIAEKKGVRVYEVLTGFKYIAELAKTLEKESAQYLFGYEESYGYMPRLFVRDKDAIQAVLLLAQIAEMEKQQGRTLVDRLQSIYQEYGYYIEGNISQDYPGIAGKEKMKGIMGLLRKDFVEKSGLDIVRIQDFLISEETIPETGLVAKINLPASDVLKFYLRNGSWVAVRPSGTEPKIKYYFSVSGESQEAAEELLKDFQERFFLVLES